ncbi:unnamed protein product [Timema podura]|uniref:G2/M phase-specific E3 ubiquitin-protein ligase n=1 Tax=Timema podura TaxID=61482 RepID=A0ABN7NQG6_TIMPD|nr:unnamed protein product [Timema podura]
MPHGWAAFMLIPFYDHTSQGWDTCCLTAHLLSHGYSWHWYIYTDSDPTQNFFRLNIHSPALSAHIMPKPSDERLKPYTGPNKSCVFCFKAQGTDHLSEDLLSSGIAQNGDDNEGILGFLPKDITKELTRSRCLTGATIECCARRCKKIFHLPCGTKRGSIHHYFNNFQSFCPDHRPPPVLKPKGIHRKEKGGRNTTKCVMCLEEVVMIRNKDVIQAPCCGHCSWFHRLCVQKLANNAGYFFKCPCCNNKNIFQKAMLHEGIFIPDQ